jgi:L-glyceraldehyde 3-phosphate reductase
MALSWLLKDKRITTVLIGASSVQQLDNNIDALNNPGYTQEELNAIETILKR